MALMTSRALGRALGRSTGLRRCPVCGAANCTCGGPSNVVAVDERMEAAVSKGKMVRIPTGRPGVTIQMYEEETRKRGLLPPAAGVAHDKARRPGANKARRAPAEGE